MKKSQTFAATVLGASVLLLPVAAMAQTADDWNFEASINGYLPTLGGSTIFPAGSGGSSLNVDAQTIIDHLKMVFMGSFEARKGLWGGYTDVLYMNLGGSKSGTSDLRPNGGGLVTANANLDLKATAWTLAGTYRAMASPQATLDVLAGARYLDVKSTLGWSFIGNGPAGIAPSGTSTVGTSLWDAVVGVKGKVFFGDEKRWFAPYYADIGTGGSDLTYQLMAGVGYAFKWGDIVGAWRYLDYNMKSGKAIESLNLNGPMVSVAFRW